MRGTLGDTGWFESTVDPVQAVVAFDRLARGWIKLRDIPGAGILAGHAADAFLLIDMDDTVGSFQHGVSRADRHALRVLAVVAGTKRKDGFGHSAH